MHILWSQDVSAVIFSHCIDMQAFLKLYKHPDCSIYVPKKVVITLEISTYSTDSAKLVNLLD